MSFPESETRRGRVIKEGIVCPTLDTGCQVGVVQVGQIYGTEKEPNPQAGRVYDADGISPCLDSCGGGNRMPKIVRPCLTPDRIEKRQNGRRFKENGEEMFTLTAQDRHGVAVRCLRTTRTDYGKAIRKEYENGDIQISRHAFLQSDIRPDDLTNTLSTVQKDNLIAESVNAGVHPCVWWDKYKSFVSIRRLTPKECFRLQGWSDDYFEKAQFVNSDSQLYKQAGNGVTVNVIEAIARRF